MQRRTCDLDIIRQSCGGSKFYGFFDKWKRILLHQENVNWIMYPYVMKKLNFKHLLVDERGTNAPRKCVIWIMYHIVMMVQSFIDRCFEIVYMLVKGMYCIVVEHLIMRFLPLAILGSLDQLNDNSTLAFWAFILLTSLVPHQLL